MSKNTLAFSENTENTFTQPGCILVQMLQHMLVKVKIAKKTRKEQDAFGSMWRHHKIVCQPEEDMH